MKCRSCQAEIAEKAIVCYRCGTPTAVEARPPAPAARRHGAWRVRIVVLALLAVAVAGWWSYCGGASAPAAREARRLVRVH